MRNYLQQYVRPTSVKRGLSRMPVPFCRLHLDSNTPLKTHHFVLNFVLPYQSASTFSLLYVWRYSAQLRIIEKSYFQNSDVWVTNVCSYFVRFCGDSVVFQWQGRPKPLWVRGILIVIKSLLLQMHSNSTFVDFFSRRINTITPTHFSSALYNIETCAIILPVDTNMRFPKKRK